MHNDHAAPEAPAAPAENAYIEPLPKKPSEVMVDIETLSTSTHNAVVLSIAAARFTLDQRGAKIEQTGLWVPDLHAQIAKGRGISDATMKWWRAQDDDARAHWKDTPPIPVIDALQGLGTFICDMDTPIWSNGCCFDIGNLESLFAQWEMPVPWRYNAVRDARTIYKATPQLRDKKIEPLPAHNPINDCVNQIWRLWEHRAETDL